ncbi:MAG: hypothetical protein AAF211_16930 [Myxococcota bacterium]
MNLWFGAAMHMPAEHVTPEIDSQIRFFAVWFMAAGALGLYMVPQIATARSSPCSSASWASPPSPASAGPGAR